MKKFAIALLLAATLMGCGGKTYHDNLGIPDKVEVKREGNYIQFPDSRVFIAVPEGFELNSSQVQARLRKDKRNFIEVTEEYNNRSIDEMKDAFENTIEEVKKKHPSAFCKIQDFKLGDYEARFIYISNFFPGTDKTTLLFGNDKYAVNIGSTLENEDRRVSKKIMDAMLTAYIDFEAKPDPNPFANYTIDLSGSKYKFNSFKPEEKIPVCVYSESGYDIEYVPNGNNFIIMQFADSIKSTIEDRKEVAIAIADESAKDGSKTVFRQERNLTIGDEEAYEIITDKKFGELKATMETYLLCFDISGHTYVLIGYMFDDFDGTIKTYRSLVKTMKLKH